MLNRVTKPFLIALTVLCSTGSYANNFSHNYIEVRTGISPGSFGAEMSSMLTENAHLVGRTISRFEGDVDVAAGAGFHGPVGNFVDVTGEILLHYINQKHNSSSDDSIEIELNLGGRLWLTEQLEATGKIGTLDESSIFSVGARFHSTEHLSIALENYNNGLYGPHVSLSVRFNY